MGVSKVIEKKKAQPKNSNKATEKDEKKTISIELCEEGGMLFLPSVIVSKQSIFDSRKIKGVTYRCSSCKGRCFQDLDNPEWKLLCMSAGCPFEYNRRYPFLTKNISNPLLELLLGNE